MINAVCVRCTLSQEYRPQSQVKACSKTLTTGTTENSRNNGYFDRIFSENAW